MKLLSIKFKKKKSSTKIHTYDSFLTYTSLKMPCKKIFKIVIKHITEISYVRLSSGLNCMCFIVSQIFYGYFIHFKVIKASFMLHIEHKVIHPQMIFLQKRTHILPLVRGGKALCSCRKILHFYMHRHFT